MEFVSGKARKQGEASLLRIEAEKTRRAGLIGIQTGFFRVPKVLHVDLESGIFDCEYFPELGTFGSLIVQGFPKIETVSFQVGRALSAIHRDLSLDEDMVLELSPPWKNECEDSVFIHGDFTSDNVCYDHKSNQLIIVDWMAAPLVGHKPTRGLPAFDLVMFVQHLFLRAPWQKAWNWPAAILSDAFLRGYVENSGRLIDAFTWHQFRKAFEPHAFNTISRRIKKTPWIRKIPRYLVHRKMLNAWQQYKPPQGLLSE